MKQLNNENISYFLDNYENIDFRYRYANATNLYVYYSRMIVDIVSCFFDTYTNVDKPKRIYQNMGGFVHLDDNYKDRLLHNMIRINFIKFYPIIIVKMHQGDKFRFDVEEYAVIYNYLVINYEKIKDTTSNIELLDFILNYCFMHYSRGGYSNVITYQAYKIYNDLMKHDIVYIDTSIIYVDELTQDIINTLDNIGLPYNISYDVNIMFIGKKRYISEHHNTITNRLSKKHDVSLASEFINEVNLFKRNNKINKLLNKS